MSVSPPAWLNIIGVSEAGIDTLPANLRAIISQADVVFGAPRFLSQLGKIQNQTHHIWQSPFVKMIDKIVEHHAINTVVLASGDPNWFGIGSTLSRRLAADEFVLHPVPSSFQLTAAHMHWPMQEITTISLHGRSVENLHKAIFPGARILALTSNSQTIIDVASLLNQREFSNSKLCVLENLGSEQEKIISLNTHDVATQKIGELYVLAIECIADTRAKVQSLTPGLANDLFEHDGQLTKRHVRAITLSSLSPYPGALLWDIGAGSGSVGIEWMRAAPNAKTICFEKSQQRCGSIAQNKDKLGVPELQISQGSALDNLGQHPAPDAIFIGGNVADKKQFGACWQALKPGGRMVTNAVTLQGMSAVYHRQKLYGGELCSIAISEIEQLGASTIMQPKLPVIQWSITKPMGEKT